MKKQFRVAVIGCGAICSSHIRALLETKQDICALCDVDPTHAAEIIEKHALGEIPVYTDYREMLDAEHPDSVHICTPHYLHAPMCIEALKRNIHVLCEKPLSINEEQLAAVLEAAKASRAQLGVCHQNRYEPNILRLRELVMEHGVRGACGLVVWYRGEEYYRSGEWRGKWDTEGGGVMINQALHTLDLLQWICGTPVSVTAHINTDALPDVIEVEDTAVARFETADGKILNFFATVGAGTSFPARLQVKLGNKSVVSAETKLLVVDNVAQNENTATLTGEKAEWGSGHSRLIADFYACIEEGRPFPIDAEAGAVVVRLILAMYRSNGKQIKI